MRKVIKARRYDRIDMIYEQPVNADKIVAALGTSIKSAEVRLN